MLTFCPPTSRLSAPPCEFPNPFTIAGARINFELYFKQYLFNTVVIQTLYLSIHTHVPHVINTNHWYPVKAPNRVTVSTSPPIRSLDNIQHQVSSWLHNHCNTWPGSQAHTERSHTYTAISLCVPGTPTTRVEAPLCKQSGP